MRGTPPFPGNVLVPGRSLRTPGAVRGWSVIEPRHLDVSDSRVSRPRLTSIPGGLADSAPARRATMLTRADAWPQRGSRISASGDREQNPGNADGEGGHDLRIPATPTSLRRESAEVRTHPSWECSGIFPGHGHRPASLEDPISTGFPPLGIEANCEQLAAAWPPDRHKSERARPRQETPADADVTAATPMVQR